MVNLKSLAAHFQKSSLVLIIAAFIGLGLSYGKFYFFHLALMAYLVFGLFAIKQFKLEFKRIFLDPKFIIPIFVFLWYLLSAVWSAHPISSLVYSVYWVFGIVIIFSFRLPNKSIEEFKKIIKFLSIIVFIELIISILEGFTVFRYPISPYFDYVHWFGREIAYDSNLDVHLIHVFKRTPTGFRWNPNDLAAVMILVIPFFIFLKNKLIRGLGILGIVGVISLSGSRTAFFSLFVVAIFFIVLYTKWSDFKKNFKMILLFAFVAFLGFLAVKQFSNHKFSNLSTTFQAAKIFITQSHENTNPYSSISIRQNLIKNGFKGLIESKGFGVGGGNSVYLHHRDGMYFTNNITSLHNFWFEVLVEGGFLIFALFMGWYFYIFGKLFLLARKTQMPDLIYFANAGSLSMLAFFIAAITMSSAIYFLPMWILLGLNISIIDYFERTKLIL